MTHYLVRPVRRVRVGPRVRGKPIVRASCPGTRTTSQTQKLRQDPCPPELRSVGKKPDSELYVDTVGFQVFLEFHDVDHVEMEYRGRQQDRRARFRRFQEMFHLAGSA